ncbi:30S ribosomal protein S20 [Candidatus Saccharibacteria bacterium]|nr:30S ribosomal protein S20 [Candidatus Saccharibacteria bacterium]
MPIIKSAKKRVKQTRKATARNARTKKTLRSALKLFSKKASSATHSKAQSTLDKAAKKGLLHKNKVARKKRQLAAAAKKAGVKHTGTKKAAAKKAPPKKSVAKKAPAKKKTTKKK